MSVRTLLDGDLMPGHRVAAEHRVGPGSLRFGVAADPEGARVAAFGIVGAADKGAEAAELQRQAAGTASRAQAGVAAGAVVGEKVTAEIGVERFEHRLDS